MDKRWLICGTQAGEIDRGIWLHGYYLFVTLLEDAQERAAILIEN
jgi:hypothetical protein